MEITFLGATGTVTGSKYLLTTSTRRVLVDCGLFQGFKNLRLKNRDPFPVDPASLDAVVLTHAHLDHTGYLPLLAKNGFRGPVHCTTATMDLLRILLPDSGHLQEEEAEFANRHGYSRHAPALPLYTREDAEKCLGLLRGVHFEREVDLGGGLRCRFRPAGHILGAAMVPLGDRDTTILFSGDLGRPHDPLLPPPAQVPGADYLLVESTYGDRLHATRDPADHLAEIVRRTASRGGTVLIPSFAVGRAQMLVYLLHQLRDEGRIPDVPLFLDSPMAAEATRILERHTGDHLLSAEEAKHVFAGAEIVESVEESKRVDRMNYPRIVVSASGMLTGGRVLHHLKAMAGDPRNTLLFAGFQAGGTRGAQIVGGSRSVKVHGGYVPIRAEVAVVENLSAHADQGEIMAWLQAFGAPPRQTWVVHGEPPAADALRLRIETELGWPARVPEYAETARLVDGEERHPATPRG